MVGPLKFSTGVQTWPRFSLQVIDVPTESLSQFTDRRFADARVFPQPVLDWILSHQDELELHNIYPEYLPYLGLRPDLQYYADLSPQLDPMLHLILDLCLDQLDQLDQIDQYSMTIEI